MSSYLCVIHIPFALLYDSIIHYTSTRRDIAIDPQQFATVIDPASIIDTSIIDLLGIQGATDDQKQQIIDDALATIHTRILARILDSIPEPEQASFDQLIDSGDNEKVKLYLIQKGIDMTRIASEEALNYKVELVGLVKDNAHNQHTVQPSVAPQQPAPQPQPTTSAQSAVTQPLSQQNVASPNRPSLHIKHNHQV
ncbi:hypothetical protein COS66_02930 [Candidatus Berkelbacteria bacterium CG06_land_8_20_14_3_00_43_10]|nr:MAG: hypothetical protein COS66_02930 [Candidatus Berkelbacteria bacterium CG06_land_8_20_14_3_00_43_10]